MSSLDPMRAVRFLPLLFITVTALGGVRERQYPSGREFFIRAPAPEYPFEARRTHQEGEGRFRLYIDRSGRVTDIKVLQSTGHALLDAAAIKAFRSFQARPGTRRETDVPISFKLTSRGDLPPRSPYPHPLIVREFAD